MLHRVLPKPQSLPWLGLSFLMRVAPKVKDNNVNK